MRKRFTALLLSGLLLLSTCVTAAEPEEAEAVTADDGIVITASTFQTGNIPSHSYDKDLATRWAAEGVGQWIQYALPEARELEGIGLAYRLGTQRTYFFEIQLSEDGENFTSVYTGETSGSTDGIEWYSFEKTTATYVRIIGNGNSDNLWNNISEISFEQGVNQMALKVFIDGAQLQTDKELLMKNDRILVPMRAVFEALDAEVDWEEATETVRAKKGGNTLVLTANSEIAYINGEEVSLEAPAEIIDDTTYVPLRICGEALNVEVQWEDSTQRASLYSETYYEVLDILQNEIDPLYSGVYDWLASLYDPESGGFYCTVSGRDREGFIPGLETTGFVTSILLSRSGLKASMPESIQEKISEFFLSRQSDETGFFYDLTGPVDDRNQARVLAQTLNGLTRLGAKPRYLLPSERVAAEEETTQTASDTTLTLGANGLPAGFPDYLVDTKTYLAWIESQRWDTNSWEAGDRVDYSLDYIQMMDEEWQKPYLETLFTFLAEKQDPETGYWTVPGDRGFNAASGCFKVLYMYRNADVEIPNMDKILDSIIYTLQEEDPADATAACYIRNPIDVLNTLAERGMGAEIKKRMPEIVRAYVGYITPFLCPDGGFSSNIGVSRTEFGGIPAGAQLWEGDVDGTLQIFCIRQYLYNLFDSSLGVPHMTEYEEGFWDKVLAAEPPVKMSAYAKPGEVVVSENANEINGFSDLDNTWTDAGYGMLSIQDGFPRGNHYFALNDTSVENEAKFSVTFPKIQDTAVIEFKMLIDREDPYEQKVTDLGYMGVNLYCSVKRLVSINTAENKENALLLQAMSQYSPSSYKTLTEISRAEWMDVRIEYSPNGGENPTVRYYINNVLQSAGNDVWTNVGTGYGYVDRIEFYTSPGRKAVLQIDNLKVSCIAQ